MFALPSRKPSRQFITMVVIVVCVLGFLILPRFSRPAVRDAVTTPNNFVTCPTPTGDSKEECKTEFVKYHPSAFEDLWWKNIDTWQNSVCKQQNSQGKENKQWLDFTKEQPLCDPELTDESSAVISKLEYTLTCGSESPQTFFRAMEPIAGTTRHPGVCSAGESEVFNKQYISVDCTNILKSKRFYYFDLGASTWSAGCCGEGPSQAWFVEAYQACGFKFHGLYMWEAKTYDPNEIWNLIPPDLKPVYHWYNIPASPDPKSPDNPLNYIRKLATKKDFVVLKIDIDTPSVENPLVYQLASDPQLMELVDDFYFEHHVNSQPMSKYWVTWWQGITQSASMMNGTLKDSFSLFRKLRENGVAAHAWI